MLKSAKRGGIAKFVKGFVALEIGNSARCLVLQEVLAGLFCHGHS